MANLVISWAAQVVQMTYVSVAVREGSQPLEPCAHDSVHVGLAHTPWVDAPLPAAASTGHH